MSDKIDSLPPRSLLDSLADHKFILLLTSLSLWIDVVLALTLHKSLVQVDLVWAKSIPIGLSLIVLVGYGLCLNLILPPLTVVLNRLWRRGADIYKMFPSKNIRGSEWYPDPNRDIYAPDLEIEAVHSGNDVLARYARRHIDSVIAEFRTQEHFVLIGTLLLLEVIVAGTATDQLANDLPYGLQRAVSAIVLIIGLASLREGARAQSTWVLHLRRPKQKAR